MKKTPNYLFFLGLVVMLGCGGASEKTTILPQDVKPTQPKKEKKVAQHAEITTFVLARCPHAASIIRSLTTLKKEMGASIGLRFSYLGMLDEQGKPDRAAGETEITAAMTQACVSMKVEKEAWLKFLMCTYNEDNWRSNPPLGWKTCAGEAGIDTTLISECLDKGEGEAILAGMYGMSMALGVEASPTLIIDGSIYLGDRSYDNLKRYICHVAGTPETMPTVCDQVSPPPPVAATLLYDSRCTDPSICDVSREIALLKQLFLGLVLKEIDFTTDEGKHLFDLIGKTRSKIDELPLIVLEKSPSENAGSIELIRNYLIPFGKGYLLAMGNGWNPLAEICDNEIDDTGNGLIDCHDSSCAETPACRQEQKGRLDLFFMSGCPFSAKLLPVIDRLLEHFGKDRKQIDLNLQFIGGVHEDRLVSMHGPEEVAEDLRMICAQKLYGKNYRFMEYITCRAKTFDSPAWETCVPKWMNKKRLLKCAEGDEGRKLLKESFEFANKVALQGSPSWLLNNRLPMEGRNLKSIIEGFCAHNDSSVCQKEIPKEPDIQTNEETGRCR